MKRKQIRKVPSAKRLAKLYPTPHDHRLYGYGHHQRVVRAIEMANELGELDSVADLSCGNAIIARAIKAQKVILGDLAEGYEHHGPIETTIDQIPSVDLFVCCETLEHLADPDSVLAKIRAKTKYFLVTTPIGAFKDKNKEHLWAWDQEAVEVMYTDARFEVQDYSEVDSTVYDEPYVYGVWLCR